MYILAINAGSSSLKFAMYDFPQKEKITSGLFERIKESKGHYKIKYNGQVFEDTPVLPDHTVAVDILVKQLLEIGIIKDIKEIKGIGHRAVQGGDSFVESTLITDEVISKIIEYYDLAPLHNPGVISGINGFMNVLPDVKNVAVFDTAFHQTMSEETYLYPINYDLSKKYGIRKYGFHGTSHRYLSLKLAEIDSESKKVITCHLGNGASLAAIKDGKSIDTTMGFTPLAGVMMGTRSGDIDPSIINFLCQKLGKNAEEVTNMLNKESGVFGLFGKSDMRDLEEAVIAGDERAILTYNMYIRRIVDYIMTYIGRLEGVDAIIFAGGVGENSDLVRRDVIKKLNFLNISLDENKNKTTKNGLISDEISKTKCYVLPTDEELMIASDAFEIITRG